MTDPVKNLNDLATTELLLSRLIILKHIFELFDDKVIAI